MPKQKSLTPVLSGIPQAGIYPGMPSRSEEQLWMHDYYGNAPFPGGRFVDRVPVNGAVQPWPSDTLRHVSRRWLGPVNIRAQGIVFTIRYVGIHEHVGRGTHPLHTHPHSEILLTLSGRGTIRTPEHRTAAPCEPGHLAVFPPACPHQSGWTSKPGEPWRLLVVDFDLALDLGQALVESGETVDLAFAPFYEYFFIRHHRGYRLPPEDRASPRDIPQGSARSLDPRQYGICTDIVAGLLRTISLVSRCLRRNGQADGLHLAPPGLSKEATLLKARALMEQGEMLDAGCVARIARTIGMSEAHFIREFKRAYGTTPKQYSQEVLMRRATAWMGQTDVNIKEIAFHLGYEDPASFSRAFHRHVGLSPAAFRRRHLAAPPD